MPVESSSGYIPRGLNSRTDLARVLTRLWRHLLPAVCIPLQFSITLYIICQVPEGQVYWLWAFYFVGLAAKGICQGTVSFLLIQWSPCISKRCRILVSSLVRSLDPVGLQPWGHRSGLSRTGKHFTISVSLMKCTTQRVHRLYSVGGRIGARERTAPPVHISSRTRLCL